MPEVSEQNVQRLAEAVNAHNPDQLLKECADRFIYEDNFLHTPILDKNQYKQYLRGWFGAFPDIRLTPEKVVAKEKTAACLARIEGTHQGNLTTPEGKQLPPTHKRFTELGAIHAVYDDQGRITELRVFQNPVGMLKQLGVDPGQLR